MYFFLHWIPPLIDISLICLDFSILAAESHWKENMSQISYLGPSFYFIKYKKWSFPFVYIK